MKALMKKDKKGFTLVEVIVVLVILAILAAVLVPTLTGYINKAKESVIVAETRSVVMAAQTYASEDYGKGTLATNVTDSSASSAFIGLVKTLSEVEGTITSITIDTATGKVTGVEYKDHANVYKCIYAYAAAGSTYTTSKAS